MVNIKVDFLLETMTLYIRIIKQNHENSIC